MAVLYVTSLQRGVGKTAICAGIGKHLLGDGKKIGFFKPLIADTKQPPIEDIDSDAVFMKQIFALEEPVDCLCPVISDESNLTSKIKEACATVSQGKDVVIVEGIGELSQTGRQVVETLGARVIIVESYSKVLPGARITSSCKDFWDYLLGVVLNRVPRSQLDRVRSEMSTHFGESGINVLGVLPEDRFLFTLTVAELAEHIQGEVLSCADQSAELVENLMLGAMGVDPGPQYFSRRANKAVVIRGERPDMQLAALETSTRCLVLSGNIAPTPAVLSRAEDKKVPVILAKEDVATIVASIEDALNKTRFNQEKKLPGLTEIVEPHFNFQAVYQGLRLIA